ncbi:MAG: hypothetical protein EXS58_07435 [Candidatus Latescibacteria bacterium]|nr:hypothetical protein [Candidatus Latescibacterota bacterium]
MKQLLGAILLVAGILLALPLAWLATSWLLASLWTLGKLLCGALLIWCGWQWLNSRGASTKGYSG